MDLDAFRKASAKLRLVEAAVADRKFVEAEMLVMELQLQVLQIERDVREAARSSKAS